MLDLEDFTGGSPNCSAPCFLGLVPGQSSISEIDTFFARLGVPVDERRHFVQGTYSSDYADVPWISPRQALANVAVVHDQHRVASIELSYFGDIIPEFLTLPSLSAKYGPPDEILLDIYPGEVGYRFELYLAYHEPEIAMHIPGALVGVAQPSLCLTHENTEGAVVWLSPVGTQSLLSEVRIDYPTDPAEYFGVPTERAISQLGAGRCVPISFPP